MHKNIRLYTENDYEAMSRKGAQIYAEAIRENPTGAFGFSTGSTPIGMYAELVRMHKEEGLDFSGVKSFNLDEYYPIKRESEHSYHYFMQKHLFGRVNINQSDVFVPDGSAEDVEAEASAYEDKIAAAGGIAMQLLGIGFNGHIGFNEPGDAFEADTRLVALTESTLDKNARHFPDKSAMPRHAVTMGIRTIMAARRIMLLANGAAKAGILREALLGRITPSVPASVLQLHPSVIIIADKEAAAKL